MSPEPVSATPARFRSSNARVYWAPVDTPAPTFNPEQAMLDRAAFGESFLVVTPEALDLTPFIESLDASLATLAEEALLPYFVRQPPVTSDAILDLYADYRPRHVTGWLPDETWAAAADGYSPDAAGIRFSEITAEAEAEMAEWDAILRGGEQ